MEHGPKPARWEGTRGTTLKTLGWRLVRHLTRRTALIAFLLAGASAAGAWAAGPATATGQVLLVIVGILASVVVLPDAPHRLWNVTADDLAGTVPSPKLVEAGAAVGRAIVKQAKSPVPEAAAAELWDKTIQDLGLLLEDPSRLVLDVSYRITVSPGSGRPMVTTSISSKRCVPRAKDGRVWFSFCSNLDALSSEFSEHPNGCISRELIDRWDSETAAQWSERVKKYRVDFIVDGQPAERDAHEVISDGKRDVVRVPFKAQSLARSYVSTELVVEFHANPVQRHFPVKFSSYYVIGATQVTFEIADPAAEVACDEYMSAVTRQVTAEPTKLAGWSGYRVRSSADTVLPPGSGVVFYWHNPPAKAGETR